MSRQPNVAIRVNRTEGYTTISTYHLRDKRLSLKAKGLLSSLLATPPGWSASVAGFAATCKDGKAGINTAMKELEEAGYVTRLRRQDEHGRFTGMEYTVNELPQTEAPTPQETADPEPFAENRQMDESNQPFTDFPSTEKPLMEKPSTEKPLTENQPQYNNIINLSNKKSTPKPPEGVESEAGFAQFWAAYPRKTAKARANRAWRRLKVDETTLAVILAALERDKQSDQWQRDGGQYIPYPATWLHDRRWEDADPGAAAPAPAGTPEREVELW